MHNKSANIALILGLSFLLAGAAFFGWRVHTLARDRQEVKQDYSLYNSISLGLFSVDTWRDKISGIMDEQINGYHITAEQKKELQLAVEKELHALITKTVREIDRPQKSIGGKLKKMAFHALADSGALQAQVRPFAATIVQKVSSPSSQARLKRIASSKLNQLEAQTYDATSEADTNVNKYISRKYGVSDRKTFEKAVDQKLAAISRQTLKNTLFLLGCVLTTLLLWLGMRRQVHLQKSLFVISLLFAAVLLAVGLTSPAIEVDARISALHFSILGEQVSFQNQVLFFQSKSIWGIITTLFSQPKPDAITVGILILLFILVLPLVRLVAKGLRLFAPTNKVVHYLAFEAGKWDMADVMIVGMLMTYIGLNAILKSQLANLNIHNDTLTTATINYTSLQPGYFIFVTYVVFEIILSYILKGICAYEPKPRPKWKKRSQHSPDAKVA